eukprot:4446887-Ditylum_brightwellii.AAC.1
MDVAGRLFIMHAVMELQWKSWVHYYVLGLMLSKKKTVVAGRLFIMRAVIENYLNNFFFMLQAVVELQWKL